ncbi:MAG: RNA methyltransferase [Bacteroidota bacterium]
MRKLTHAEIAQKRQQLESITDAHRLPVTVVLDNIRSLYNIGSIFRTSDGVLLQKLILTGFSPIPPRKEIEKTALGATLSVPWEYVKEPHEAVLRLKGEGFKAYCLELTESSAPYDTPARADFPLCLVLGNEITGVSRQTISVCDGALEIPQFGTKQSLNVAVAYGIAIFELNRIWRNGTAAPTPSL